MAQQGNRLKYIAIYKISTLKIINSACNEKSEDAFKKESDKVATQIKSLGLQDSERQRINTNSGCWNCTIDSKDVMYLILTVTSYPERHAYAIPPIIQQDLNKNGDYANYDELTMKNLTKNTLKDVSKRYNDLEAIDKIYLAQQQVNETQLVMEDNVKKMLQNQQNLDVLTAKSENMNSQAQSFYKNSSDLAKIMYWRNMKLKIIMGLIVVCGLCYVFVPIIIRFTASSN